MDIRRAGVAAAVDDVLVRYHGMLGHFKISVSTTMSPPSILPHILRLPDGRTLDLGEGHRPKIMAILNVTPDSFSDGGTYDTTDAAAAHTERMLAEGADVIDVGGESTRPGSHRVPAEEQKRRVLEVVERVSRLKDWQGRQAIVSIDTTLSAVAEAALDRGASIINDISAGRDDPRMFGLAASRGVPIVLMHMQGEPGTMQREPQYQDVVAEVRAFLLQRVEAARAAGVRREQIVLDPGIGFGKTREHNLALMKHLGALVKTGYPVLLGASRKRFMGSILTPPGGETPAPRDLAAATCATTALAVAAGVTMFRVHDVRWNRQAADVAWAVVRFGP